ncbi:MAG: isoprenylcysteine carboxylmethyltransferase family protein [Alphaproteobacteria bacterium]
MSDEQDELNEPIGGNTPVDVAATKLHPPKALLTWIVVAVVLDFFLPLATFASELRWVGFCLVGVALGLFAWSLQTFKRVGTDVKTTTPADNLASDGPYGISRNPIYLAMITLGVGLGLLLGNMWLLIGAIVFYGLITKLVIEPEEAYMERAFGDKYITYRCRVRRWV